MVSFFKKNWKFLFSYTTGYIIGILGMVGENKIGYIVNFILGMIIATVIVCSIVVNKINEYEKRAISEINKNKKLMSELYELKYGNNKHITM